MPDRKLVARAVYEGVLDDAVRETKDKLGVASRRPTGPEDGVVPADEVIDVEEDWNRFTSSVERDGVKATVTVTLAGA